VYVCGGVALGIGVGGSFEREGVSVNVCVSDVFVRSTCARCVYA